jgi:hypothetical protein
MFGISTDTLGFILDAATRLELAMFAVPRPMLAISSGQAMLMAGAEFALEIAIMIAVSRWYRGKRA